MVRESLKSEKRDMTYSAKDRRSFVAGNTLGNWCNVVDEGNDVFLEGAVDGKTTKLGLRAVLLAALDHHVLSRWNNFSRAAMFDLTTSERIGKLTVYSKRGRGFSR